MQAIPTSIVTCPDGSTDTFVGFNPNADTGDKIQAFVNCFKSAAQYSSSLCSGLPVKLILAQWGYESGWATGGYQKDNQNWSNVIYLNSNNPPGNSGSGVGSPSPGIYFAKFCGRTKHAYGYGYWFHKEYNPVYSQLMDYLQWCQLKGDTPSETTCARYIADAGYSGGDPDYYYNTLVACMDTVCRNSDFC